MNHESIEYEQQTIRGNLATLWHGQGDRSDALGISGDDVFVLPTKYCHCLTCGKEWDRYQSPYQPPPPNPETICGTPDGYRKHHRFILRTHSPWSRGFNVLFSNGDHLTVFDPADPQQVIWSGKVVVENRLRQLGRRQRYWQYCDLPDVSDEDRKQWFDQRYPAELVYSDSVSSSTSRENVWREAVNAPDNEPTSFGRSSGHWATGVASLYRRLLRVFRRWFQSIP